MGTKRVIGSESLPNSDTALIFNTSLAEFTPNADTTLMSRTYLEHVPKQRPTQEIVAAVTRWRASEKSHLPQIHGERNSKAADLQLEEVFVRVHSLNVKAAFLDHHNVVT